MNKPSFQTIIAGLLVGSAAVFLSGCAVGRHTVIASTGTSLGIDLSQDAATQTPRIKVGYNRAELALVPSNRSAHKDPGSRLVAALCPSCVAKQGHCATPEQCAAVLRQVRDGGAADTGEVIMEIRMQGGTLFNGIQDAGVYQRLAVGKLAVAQPGASLMFARDKAGAMDANAVQAVAKATAAVRSIPESSADAILERDKIIAAYIKARKTNDATTLARIEQAAKDAGYADGGGTTAFQKFAMHDPPDVKKIEQIKAALTSSGVKID